MSGLTGDKRARRGLSAGGLDGGEGGGGGFTATSRSRREESEAKAALLRSRCVSSGWRCSRWIGRGYTICHCQRSCCCRNKSQIHHPVVQERFWSVSFSLPAAFDFFCAKVSLIWFIC
ncbi:hypothetical protein PAHAL_1G351200 [Panicum hallii]|uniref:Uncharacterized protein n=1 Tax=Panicum hallii TaxID=206008 RepID=A0A2T8KX88_9POAL|nr:hypothetical protein PAHAL_1G351200 [Panicum hallii]